MRPVQVPPIAVGDDARERLAVTREALGLANARLSASAGWYEGVLHSYGKPQ